MGRDAGRNITTGGANLCIGHNAADAADHTGVCAIGQFALSSNTADYNTSVGYESLRYNTSGANNTAVGKDALYSNTTASNNTVGTDALQQTQQDQRTLFGA